MRNRGVDNFTSLTGQRTVKCSSDNGGPRRLIHEKEVLSLLDASVPWFAGSWERKKSAGQ